MMKSCYIKIYCIIIPFFKILQNFLLFISSDIAVEHYMQYHQDYIL